MVRLGLAPNGRVGIVLLGAFLGVGLLMGLVYVTEESGLFMLSAPLLLGIAGLYFVPELLRARRERFAIRNGTRSRGRVVRFVRVGSVGAYPASPLLELTIALTTPDGKAVEATTRQSASRDPRVQEAMIGRELWLYWHPRFPRVAALETRAQLPF